MKASTIPYQSICMDLSRDAMIADFQHFLDTHKEEVKAHICQPPYDFLDDDDWEDCDTNRNTV